MSYRWRKGEGLLFGQRENLLFIWSRGQFANESFVRVKKVAFGPAGWGREPKKTIPTTRASLLRLHGIWKKKSNRGSKELYFRINGICLRLPPLRDRKQDMVFTAPGLAASARYKICVSFQLSDGLFDFVLAEFDIPCESRSNTELYNSEAFIQNLGEALSRFRMFPNNPGGRRRK